MITLLVIIFIIWVIYASLNQKPDQKDREAVADAISKLPSITLRGKRVQHWWDSKGYSIDVFKYENRRLYLSLQDGKSLQGLLTSYTFKIYKLRTGDLEVHAELGGNSLHFYIDDNIFSEDEWEIICNVIVCAGKTYNKEYLGKRAKLQQMAAAGQVAKLVFKLLSQ